jgi:hypothetical protein
LFKKVDGDYSVDDLEKKNRKRFERKIVENT